MIIEYHTARHAEPLVLMPRLGIMYLKNNAQDAHIGCNFLIGLHEEMNEAARNGGDFSLKTRDSNNNDNNNDDAPAVAIFCIWMRGGHAKVTITSENLIWKIFYSAILKIQRFAKPILFRKRKPSHHLKMARTFQNAALPAEIILSIVKFYFEIVTKERSQRNKYSAKTIVETSSFVALSTRVTQEI
jgi:hypothetical protein